jgi:hypothetical protein
MRHLPKKTIHDRIEHEIVKWECLKNCEVRCHCRITDKDCTEQITRFQGILTRLEAGGSLTSEEVAELF